MAWKIMLRAPRLNWSANNKKERKKEVHGKFAQKCHRHQINTTERHSLYFFKVHPKESSEINQSA